MGREARANPRSLDGTPERQALIARLERFAASFATRAEFDAYVEKAEVSADVRAYLDRFLPARMRVTES